MQTPDQNFIALVKERHGLDISKADLAELYRDHARSDQRYQHSLDGAKAEGAYLANYQIHSGGVGNLLVNTAVGFFSGGGWLGAAVAFAGGLIGILNNPAEKEGEDEERGSVRYGFQSGGKLAIEGTPIPLVYTNRTLDDPDEVYGGGVRIGGDSLHTRIDTLGGSNTLYKLQALGAGQSAVLNWGEYGKIDVNRLLINKQPRTNFDPQELQLFARLGTRAQTAILPEFPYYSQAITPPDYAVFGVDFRANVDQGNAVTNPDPDQTNVDIAGTTITKNIATNAWDAGAFGDFGVNGDGTFEVVPGPPGDIKAAGLSAIDVDQNQVSIAFGFRFSAGVYNVIENGALRTIDAPYTAADKFIIRVVSGGTTVQYYVNNVLVYASAITPALPLYVDVAIFTANASLDATLNGVGVTQSDLNATEIEIRDADTTFDLFNIAQKYRVCISGDYNTDPTFNIVRRDNQRQTIVTDVPLPLAGRENIFAEWVGKYETTKHVNEVHFNLAHRLSARNDDEDGDDFGELVNHGQLFDLRMRPVTDPPGSEQIVGRFLVVGKRPTTLRRHVDILNLPLGRYYFEFQPICLDPCDRDIYILTDEGVNTTYASGLNILGNDIDFRIEGYRFTTAQPVVVGNLYATLNNVTVDPIAATATTTGPDAELFGAEPVISGASLEWIYDGSETEQYIGLSAVDTPGGGAASIDYAFCLAEQGGSFIWQALQDGTVLDQGNLAIPNGTRFELEINGLQVRWKVDGNTVETANVANPAAQLYADILIPEAGVTIPIPVENNEASDNQANKEDIEEWLGYNGKYQVSSESGPTGQIQSVNEVVLPSAINNPEDNLPNRYPGIPLLGIVAIASERLQQDPGIRVLIEQGRVCPNIMAAGEASALSDQQTLVDPIAQFLSRDGAKVGWKIRNLSRKTEFQVVTITETSLGANGPMNWEEGDRYLLYRLQSTAYFPDIMADLVANDFGGIRAYLDPDEDLDYPSLADSRRFCVDQSYYCNALIQSSQSWIAWCTENMVGSRLLPMKREGRYGVRPDRQDPVSNVLNATDIAGFRLDYLDWQSSIANKIVATYTEGRELFAQDGARHRPRSIVVQTPESYLGQVASVEESLNLTTITNPDQAVQIASTYLNSLRTQNVNVTFTSSHQVAFNVAGDIISVQHPLAKVAQEYSGYASKVERYDPITRIQVVCLHCQPVLICGCSETRQQGQLQTRQLQADTPVVVGDLLVNNKTGLYGIISGLQPAPTADGVGIIFANVDFRPGDEWEVKSLVRPPGSFAWVRAGQSGEVYENLDFNYVQQGSDVCLRLIGVGEPVSQFDPVNVAGRSSLYRIQSKKPNGKHTFELVATHYPADGALYSSDGLVLHYDGEIFNKP